MIKFIKELILEFYRGDITRNVIDNAICNKSCPHRTDEDICPIDIKGECPVTDEEAVNNYLKQRFASYNGFDESMNELLRECGFEE